MVREDLEDVELCLPHAKTFEQQENLSKKVLESALLSQPVRLRPRCQADEA